MTASKFTSGRKARILQAFAAGASIRHAAAVGGVDHSTLLSWLSQGAHAAPGSRFATFYDEVHRVRSNPGLVVLEDEPEPDLTPGEVDLVWEFLDRSGELAAWADEDLWSGE